MNANLRVFGRHQVEREEDRDDDGVNIIQV
jgi:hypothetical protein